MSANRGRRIAVVVLILLLLLPPLASVLPGSPGALRVAGITLLWWYAALVGRSPPPSPSPCRARLDDRLARARGVAGPRARGGRRRCRRRGRRRRPAPRARRRRRAAAGPA